MSYGVLMVHSGFSHNFGDGAHHGFGTNVTMTRCTFMSNKVSVMLLYRGNFVNLQRSTLTLEKVIQEGL